MAIRLLPSEYLVRTGPVDHADWNYRPILGSISRQRHTICVRLLPAMKSKKMLEIGYGSGVFLPELAMHCEQLHGIDIHEQAGAVEQRLRDFGVSAHLQQATAANMPFHTGFFDAIVAISSLEFVADMPAAAREISRVLQPEGRLIVITPGNSPLVDCGLKLLTGKSAKQDYEGRREQMLPALLEHFEIEAQRTFPSFLSSVVCLYKGLRLKKKSS